MKWIPVTERLPHGWKDFVLVIDADKQIRTAMAINGCFIGPIVEPVSHWMPLPELPVSLQTASNSNDH